MPIDPTGAKKEGEKKKNSDEQSVEDRKTVKMVEQLFSTAKRARMNVDKDWIENYKFFRGKQWKEKRPSYRHSEVLNFIHAAIQTIIPILTDSRPTIETIPENPSDFEFSQIMTQVLRAKWDRDGFAQIVAEAIIDACIYGTSISEQPWNPDLLQGLGDYEFKTVDPIYCYPNPNARDINGTDNDYFITAIPKDLNELKRKYPSKAHLLKSDLSDIDMAKTAKLDMDDFRIRSATDNLSLVQGERVQDQEMPDQVLELTLWINDNGLIEEEIEQKTKDGKKIKGFRTRKKYPNGRKIVIANKVLLEDEENPYLDGKFPYAKLVDYIMPREFWGQGEVEQLKGPQMLINKLMSYTMDILSIMGNPVWKNPTGSGVFSDSLTNEPGLVVDYVEGFEPRRERGADVQASVFQAFDRLRDVFDTISGVNEVTQGAQPRNASGVAIDSLMEAAQTKLRLKGRNIEAWLTRVGQQFGSRILQFYSVPRIIRITENENAEKYFRVAIDAVTDEAGEETRVATIQRFESDPNDLESNEILQQEPIQYEIKGNLDVKISIGSTLPFARAKKEARAEKLYGLGIYDVEDLLNDMEHPRKEQILEKFNRRQLAAAQAEAQAAALQGQPGASELQQQPPIQ
jgi:hypothetical protein